MSATVGIIDYGRGNLRSVSRALEQVGARVKVSDSPRALERCRALVLPGVGAFGDAMAALRKRGFVKFLKQGAARGRLILGVCLGLQLFCEESEEFGRHEGLGFFEGRVSRFKAGLKVPHMGWNQVRFAKGFPLAGGEGEFYFVHSYRARLTRRAESAGVTAYGRDRFDSVLWRGNLLATQFHPEKSQAAGLALYRQFWKLAQKA